MKPPSRIDLQTAAQKAIITAMPRRENTNRFASARKQMVSRDRQGRDITDPAVLGVMGELAREEVVREA